MTEAQPREDYDRLPQRSYRQLEATDAMPRALRECVHEFGYELVTCLVQNGITRPTAIRNIINTIWMGARSPHNRQGLRTNHSRVLENLDWVLSQHPGPISAALLVRLLALNNMAIIPLIPNEIMIAASMATVTASDDVRFRGTKHEKHKRRLTAAIQAAVAHLWPHLLEPKTAAAKRGATS